MASSIRHAHRRGRIPAVVLVVLLVFFAGLGVALFGGRAMASLTGRHDVPWLADRSSAHQSAARGERSDLGDGLSAGKDAGRSAGGSPQLFVDKNAPSGSQVSGLGTGPVTQAVAAGKVNPVLMARFDAAKEAAARDGIGLVINSGGRTVQQQEQIFQDGIGQYGSAQAARRYVAPPEASAHTKGLALDVGPAAGAAWLDEHGATYGLCRTFDDELWHFEPVIAPGGTCPARHADASYLWK